MEANGEYLETMNMIRRIKNNLFVRNCWIAAARVENFFKGKKQFGQCCESVIITPPILGVPQRIYSLDRISD